MKVKLKRLSTASLIGRNVRLNVKSIASVISGVTRKKTKSAG